MDHVRCRIFLIILFYLPGGSLPVVGGRGHVDVKPDPGPLPAEVRHDEEAGAARLGVVAVGDAVLHVRHARAELRVLELGAVHLARAALDQWYRVLRSRLTPGKERSPDILPAADTAASQL